MGSEMCIRDSPYIDLIKATMDVIIENVAFVADLISM